MAIDPTATARASQKITASRVALSIWPALVILTPDPPPSQEVCVTSRRYTSAMTQVPTAK